jgi:hypothetical protein
MYKAIIAIIAVILLVGCAQQIETEPDTTANEDIEDIEDTINEIDTLIEDLNMSDLDDVDKELDSI